ncbi:discoidin domain-containing protein [Paenibacillus sp. FSL R7-0216]|uniref:discoidin domain-containing protein n=1 Tax=Paenibacillus rhizolycopersici TaxID=2780073 RepID=UPI001EF58DD6|nr:discoidin domain-containing protein [Paenibacillus timonensis]
MNKTTVSSTVEGVGFESGKAVDGNQMTRWASREGNDPEWIYVDLGSVQQITGVKLRWEVAYAKRYKIEISSDSGSPEHWQEVYSTSSGDGGLDEIPLAPQAARYVRMYGIERGTPYGYSLYEFEVTGQ